MDPREQHRRTQRGSTHTHTHTHTWRDPQSSLAGVRERRSVAPLDVHEPVQAVRSASEAKWVRLQRGIARGSAVGGTQAPLDGELLGVIPGSGSTRLLRFLLDRPLHLLPPSDLELARVEPGAIVRDGEPVSIRVTAIVVCARLVGEQIGPDSANLAVNVAAVIDNTALRDPVLAFSQAARSRRRGLLSPLSGRPAGGASRSADSTPP